ncbi:hypothetical protein AB434_1559 [Heyndrickxia coagulans]|uniref:Uncharacterized protein n=2 Tax=Heyndrickxia TaxID=2837504 RepID=A0AAN0WDY0_HEYCO|nr:hypothetical protein SB48_HM08orf06016 [Heyndrickxia coagulans]AKN53964.1 hypothetical protein AB434_1559 [Heyndrickxia coagulans]KYC91352.1 hypothetical protein B4096_0989 [Heyndrickxia coagulans]
MLTAGGAYTHIANMIDSYESFTRAAQKKNSLSAGSLLTCFKQAVPTPHITNMIDSRKLTRVAEEQLLTYDF